MNWMAKIGGRKFWMAIITIAVATFIELHNPGGLSTTMAAFLGSIVTAFSVANYATTAKHMDSSGSTAPAVDVTAQLESLTQQVKEANNPELVGKLVDVLQQSLSKLNEIENVSRQVGVGMVNLGNQVQILSQRRGQ